MILLADYLGCTIDYLVGRSDAARPLNVSKEFAERISDITDDFISEKSFVHPPFMNNKVYFIFEKDYDKVLKIYEKAKAYDNTIMDKDSFLNMMIRYEADPTYIANANGNGYSITPRNYVEFKKVYDIYADSCFNDMLTKKLKSEE